MWKIRTYEVYSATRCWMNHGPCALDSIRFGWHRRLCYRQARRRALWCVCWIWAIISPSGRLVCVVLRYTAATHSLTRIARITRTYISAVRMYAAAGRWIWTFSHSHGQPMPRNTDSFEVLSMVPVKKYLYVCGATVNQFWAIHITIIAAVRYVSYAGSHPCRSICYGFAHRSFISTFFIFLFRYEFKFWFNSVFGQTRGPRIRSVLAIVIILLFYRTPNHVYVRIYRSWTWANTIHN